MYLMEHELTIGALAVSLVGILGWTVRTGLTGLRKAIEANTEVVTRLLTTLSVQEERLMHKIDTQAKDHHRHEEETRDVLRAVTNGDACHLDSITADKLSRAAARTLKGESG